MARENKKLTNIKVYWERKINILLNDPLFLNQKTMSWDDFNTWFDRWFERVKKSRKKQEIEDFSSRICEGIYRLGNWPVGTKLNSRQILAEAERENFYSEQISEYFDCLEKAHECLEEKIRVQQKGLKALRKELDKEKKTFAELIDDILSYTPTSGDLRRHWKDLKILLGSKSLSTNIRDLTNDKDAEKLRANNLQTWKDNHADYDIVKNKRDELRTERDELRTERDELRTERDELRTERDESERERERERVISKLIAGCDLGLDKKSSLEQVITKINELIKKPNSLLVTTIKEQKEIISELQNEINSRDNKSSSNLETELKNELIEYIKSLGIIKKTHEEKMKKVSSYQELTNIQCQASKEIFMVKDEALSRIEKKMNISFVSNYLLIIALIFLAIISWKKSSRSKLNQK